MKWSPPVIGPEVSTSWTGDQSIAGLTQRDRQPFELIVTPMAPLTVCLWIVGGSWSTWREPTHTRGEHAD